MCYSYQVTRPALWESVNVNNIKEKTDNDNDYDTDNDNETQKRNQIRYEALKEKPVWQGI